MVGPSDGAGRPGKGALSGGQAKHGFHNDQGHTMKNKDQTEGAAKTVAGKAQAQAGRILGDGAMRAKGLAQQAEGQTQKAYGDLKEVLRISGKH